LTLTIFAFFSSELNSQIDILKHSLDQQAASLVEKEREAVKRVQAAREEEWQKLHQTENEKYSGTPPKGHLINQDNLNNQITK